MPLASFFPLHTLDYTFFFTSFSSFLPLFSTSCSFFHISSCRIWMIFLLLYFQLLHSVTFFLLLFHFAFILLMSSCLSFLWFLCYFSLSLSSPWLSLSLLASHILSFPPPPRPSAVPYFFLLILFVLCVFFYYHYYFPAYLLTLFSCHISRLIYFTFLYPPFLLLLSYSLVLYFLRLFFPLAAALVSVVCLLPVPFLSLSNTYRWFLLLLSFVFRSHISFPPCPYMTFRSPNSHFFCYLVFTFTVLVWLLCFLPIPGLWLKCLGGSSFSLRYRITEVRLKYR